jgi:hypothetical protein
MRHLINLFFAAALLPLAGNRALGTIHTAADCSVVSIQAAINLAANGDTVLIPGGSASWTNGLTITNGINLIGAGVGQTVITNAWANGPGYTSLINAVNIYPHFLHVSGFTICNSSGPYSSLGITASSSFSPAYFRFDHMQFTNISKAGITPTGWAIGVIDHCSFITVTNGGATGISINGEGAYSWDTRPPTWGDTNKVYIEDCSFYWSAAADNANGAVDSYLGARWCFRHNWVTNINVGDHGSDSSGSERSTHSFEVYNNFFTNATTSTYLVLGAFRGGTGLFFSNTVVGQYVYPEIALADYRNSGTVIYGGAVPCCPPWGPITGTNAFDGNTDPYGYPAYDSIGRTSPTIYYTNVNAPDYTNFGLNTANLTSWLLTAPYNYTASDFAAVLANVLTATNGYTMQAPQPTYAWSNTCNGGPSPIVVGNLNTNTGIYFNIPVQAAEIQAGRDYFNDTIMTNYVVYAPSNGALVSVATNVYTPLVYPHPLVTGGALQPPTNLRVVPGS